MGTLISFSLPLSGFLDRFSHGYVQRYFFQNHFHLNFSFTYKEKFLKWTNLTRLNAYKRNIAFTLLKNTEMFFFKYEFYETFIIMGNFCILKRCEACAYNSVWDAAMGAASMKHLRPSQGRKNSSRKWWESHNYHWICNWIFSAQRKQVASCFMRPFPGSAHSQQSEMQFFELRLA